MTYSVINAEQYCIFLQKGPRGWGDLENLLQSVLYKIFFIQTNIHKRSQMVIKKKSSFGSQSKFCYKPWEKVTWSSFSYEFRSSKAKTPSVSKASHPDKDTCPKSNQL